MQDILFGCDFLISSANSFAKPKSGVLVSHHTDICILSVT